MHAIKAYMCALKIFMNVRMPTATSSFFFFFFFFCLMVFFPMGSMNVRQKLEIRRFLTQRQRLYYNLNK